MKILGPREIGHGILIEYDAGSISPKQNSKILKEIADPNFDGEVEMYCILQKYGMYLIEMVECTLENILEREKSKDIRM